MTVKELKEVLDKYMKDDDEVIISSDSEGNAMSPLMEVDVKKIGEVFEWTVDGVHVEYTVGEDFQYFDREKNKGKGCIILYPTL